MDRSPQETCRLRRLSRPGGAGAALVLAAALAAGCTAAQRGPARAPRPDRTVSPVGGGGLVTLDSIWRFNAHIGTAGYGDLGKVPGVNASAWGKPGTPAVQILVNGAGQVVGVRGLFPASAGWRPWFDQPREQTVNDRGEPTSGTPAAGGTTGPAPGTPGAGPGAPSGPGGSMAPGTTGTPRGGMRSMPGGMGPGSSPGAAGGPGARTGGQAMPAAVPGTFYTQTIWFVAPTSVRPGRAPLNVASALTSFDRLKGLNPKLGSADRLTDFLPKMGYHWGHHGPGLVVMVDRAGRVTSIEGTFPATVGYQTYFDQLQGHVDVDRVTGEQVYTEHVWFVDPNTIR